MAGINSSMHRKAWQLKHLTKEERRDLKHLRRKGRRTFQEHIRMMQIVQKIRNAVRGAA